MIAGAEVGALGDADIVAELHRGEVVDPGVLANPAVVGHNQMPGILDGDAGLDDDAFADSRTKESQQTYPK